MRLLSEPTGARDLDLGLLHRRIAEAVTWCLPRAELSDPRGCLRQLPNPLHDVGLLHAQPASVVRALVKSRERSSTSTTGAPDLEQGRLLVYYPDVDLADGAAEAETRGFFDVDNTPAWDSWVALVEDPEADRFENVFLVAYVPPVLVPLVDRGIDVNPEDCIAWLDGPTEIRFGIV